MTVVVGAVVGGAVVGGGGAVVVVVGTGAGWMTGGGNVDGGAMSTETGGYGSLAQPVSTRRPVDCSTCQRCGQLANGS